MRSILLTSGLIIGCNTGFKNTALAPGFGPDADTEESCEAIARTVSPASAGQSNFFYRNDVAFSVTSVSDASSADHSAGSFSHLRIGRFPLLR